MKKFQDKLTRRGRSNKIGWATSYKGMECYWMPLKGNFEGTRGLGRNKGRTGKKR